MRASTTPTTKVAQLAMRPPRIAAPTCWRCCSRTGPISVSRSGTAILHRCTRSANADGRWRVAGARRSRRPVSLCGVEHDGHPLLDRGVVVRGAPRHYAWHTAAHVCSLWRCGRLVDVCGVDVDARNSFGDSSLHIVARRSEASSLYWLLGAGADVNCADDSGATPLHNVRDRRCAIALLAAGADVRARDCGGRSAMFDASPSIVHVLLAAGADLDDNGRRQSIDAGQVEAAHIVAHAHANRMISTNSSAGKCIDWSPMHTSAARARTSAIFLDSDLITGTSARPPPARE